MTDATVATPDPAAQPALPLEPAAPAAASPAAPAEPKPVNPNSPKWALERISEESARARQEKERADSAERDLASARELLARLQQQPQPQNQPPQQRQQEPFRQPNDQSRNAEIQEAARQQRFMDDVNDSRARGFQEYGAQAFNATIDTLSRCGVDNQFLSDVLAVDRAESHKLFHKLASDPEQTYSLTKMSSAQRIAALTRMQMADAPKANAPAPAPVPKTSAAPEPRPSSQGLEGIPSNSLGDDVDDAQWSKNWNSKYRPRKSA